MVNVKLSILVESMVSGKMMYPKLSRRLNTINTRPLIVFLPNLRVLDPIKALSED